jgi:serine/threonine protein kinase
LLTPDQVIHDRRLAQVGRLRDGETGQSFIRKVGKTVLRSDEAAVVEFLAELSADPQPNLLVPLRFSGSVGELLVEDYPDLSSQKKLDLEGIEIRRELSNGRLGVDQVVDFVAQLTDAVAFIHRHGFVHRDVRSTNVFVRREDGRLIPTLFDYGFVTRPFFLEDPELRVDLEAPPEVRVGHVRIDARYDVYQLGWLFRKLTHYEAAPDIWTPVAELSAGLKEAIVGAVGGFARRLGSAGELRDRL